MNPRVTVHSVSTINQIAQDKIIFEDGFASLVPGTTVEFRVEKLETRAFALCFHFTTRETPPRELSIELDSTVLVGMIAPDSVVFLLDILKEDDPETAVEIALANAVTERCASVGVYDAKDAFPGEIQIEILFKGGNDAGARVQKSDLKPFLKYAL